MKPIFAEGKGNTFSFIQSRRLRNITKSQTFAFLSDKIILIQLFSVTFMDKYENVRDKVKCPRQIPKMSKTKRDLWMTRGKKID